MTLVPHLLNPISATAKLLNRWRLQIVRRSLHAAADALDEIRRDAEPFYAGADPAWQEGPEGLRYVRTLGELRTLACSLRDMALPDVEGLL